ncbi:Gfo/Idh/MocA family oxidoreductase [Paenarthrobacter nitroguajacolicus]|uniref:Gfo/Idh/MocA family protein n=1 Tax=Paenarthrobacter nitroguajacolicus TaxID=211146 RepID=UPI002857F14B|nr:Gfo/Idh/MocA family oxidoreductase [Paenarthrobacter nitroguajacolicus]MDR6636986.1 putative dehydrogenase [Paenarthrobacter nitroguajacolicus]
MGDSPLRWGLAGTGGIAREFAGALAGLDGTIIAGVASRNSGASAGLRDLHGVGKSHGSLEDLAADPDIDVVYISTPAGLHKEHTITFLEAGKHVLIEKPFALNHAEALAIVETARRRGLFAMEAMWSRFLPAYVKLRQLVDSGAIGEVRGVEASFGFPMPSEGPGRISRVHDARMGGGSLLELGVYPVQLAHWMLGRPTDVAASSQLNDSGADLDTSALLSFSRGTATIRSSVTSPLPNQARILGSTGYISLPAPHQCPQEVGLSVYNTHGPGTVEEHLYKTPIEGPGLRYEIMEVARQLRAGKQESPVMPWQDTLDIMKTMDRIRASQNGYQPLNNATLPTNHKKD